MRPHRRQPTRLLRPWDSPGKNTGVGCHFLLQCRKVKSESEATQSCPTHSDPMDCSPPGSCVHGIFQARALESGAIAISSSYIGTLLKTRKNKYFWADLPSSIISEEVAGGGHGRDKTTGWAERGLVSSEGPHPILHPWNVRSAHPGSHGLSRMSLESHLLQRSSGLDSGWTLFSSCCHPSPSASAC